MGREGLRSASLHWPHTLSVMRNNMDIAWRVFKAVISIMSFSIGAWLLLVAVQNGLIWRPHPWIAFAFFSFIAAAPWIFSDVAPSQAVGFAAIFFGVGCLFMAFGIEYVPRDCYETRRRLFCHLLNWLHSKGGQVAVTTVWTIAGAFFITGGGFFLLKHKI